MTTKVVELMLERGMRASHAGRPADAVRAYGEVLAHADATDRDKGVALFNRALMRTRLGDRIGAIDDWSSIVMSTASPRWILCRAYLARAGQRVREWDDVGAICDFSAAMRLAESLGTHQSAVAESRLVIGQEWSPVELLGQAGARRGAARLDIGDSEGATEDVLRVIQMPGISKSTLGEAYAYLSEALLIAGRFDDAIEAVRRAVTSEPNLAACRTVGAVALMAKGDFATGIEEFQAGLNRMKTTESLERLDRLMSKLEKSGVTLSGVAAARRLIEKSRKELEDRESQRLATTVRRMNLGL